MLIGGFVTIPYTTVFIFILPLLVSKGILTMPGDMIAQFLLILFCIFTLLFSGGLADKISAKNVMQIGCLLLIVSTYPVLKLVDIAKTWAVLFALAALLAANELVLGPSNLFIKNLFKAQYRYRASALGFCVGISLFGGLTPIIEYKLFYFSSHFVNIALWPIFIGICLLISFCFVLPEKGDDVF